MLPNSTDANMIEQFQSEEDAMLFGSRSETYNQNFHSPHLEEGSTPNGITEFAEGFTLFESERQITPDSTKTQPMASEQTSRKRKNSLDTADSESEPPIYAWLASTEPPKDPESVFKWREEEEICRDKRRMGNIQDLEVFRNVEIASPFKNDVPVSDPHDVMDSAYPATERPTTGAYVLYRNILDQYPKLGDILAWRFANANWERMQDFQRQQRASLATTSLPTEPIDHGRHLRRRRPTGRHHLLGLKDKPYSGMNSAMETDNPMRRLRIDPNRGTFGAEPCDSFYHYSTAPYLERRKLCSLPPPPKPLPRLAWDSADRFKCHLCSQIVRIRHKRDWRCVDFECTSFTRLRLVSNHVMDDILPYLCPFSDCHTGEYTYARRRQLFAHMKLCHPEETPRLCHFCGKEVKIGLVKHIGHHMEEIAFGALSTAYEEWSYADSDSEVSILSVSSGSTMFRELIKELGPLSRFVKSSHIREHIEYAPKTLRTVLTNLLGSASMRKKRIIFRYSQYLQSFLMLLSQTVCMVCFAFRVNLIGLTESQMLCMSQQI